MNPQQVGQYIHGSSAERTAYTLNFSRRDSILMDPRDSIYMDNQQEVQDAHTSSAGEIVSTALWILCRWDSIDMNSICVFPRFSEEMYTDNLH